MRDESCGFTQRKRLGRLLALFAATAGYVIPFDQIPRVWLPIPEDVPDSQSCSRPHTQNRQVVAW